jgi:hypothetical protein
MKNHPDDSCFFSLMLNLCYPLLSIIHQLTGMILLCPAVDKPFLTISPLSNPTGFVNVTNWQSQLEISININKPQKSMKWTLTLVVDFDNKPWHVAFFVPKIHDFFRTEQATTWVRKLQHFLCKHPPQCMERAILQCLQSAQLHHSVWILHYCKSSLQAKNKKHTNMVTSPSWHWVFLKFPMITYH